MKHWRPAPFLQSGTLGPSVLTPGSVPIQKFTTQRRLQKRSLRLPRPRGEGETTRTRDAPLGPVFFPPDLRFSPDRGAALPALKSKVSARLAHPSGSRGHRMPGRTVHSCPSRARALRRGHLGRLDAADGRLPPVLRRGFLRHGRFPARTRAGIGHCRRSVVESLARAGHDKRRKTI